MSAIKIAKGELDKLIIGDFNVHVDKANEEAEDNADDGGESEATSQDDSADESNLKKKRKSGKSKDTEKLAQLQKKTKGSAVDSAPITVDTNHRKYFRVKEVINKLRATSKISTFSYSFLLSMLLHI